MPKVDSNKDIKDRLAISNILSDDSYHSSSTTSQNASSMTPLPPILVQGEPSAITHFMNTPKSAILGSVPVSGLVNNPGQNSPSIHQNTSLESYSHGPMLNHFQKPTPLHNHHQQSPTNGLAMSQVGLVLKFRIRQEKAEADTENRHDNSCTRCRKLKKKCDRRNPSCYNCSKLKYDCVYLPRKKRTKTEKPATNGNGNINGTDLDSNGTSTNKEEDQFLISKSGGGKFNDLGSNSHPTGVEDNMIISSFKFDTSTTEPNYLPRSFLPSFLTTILNEFFWVGRDFVICIDRSFVDSLDLHNVDSFDHLFELYFIFLIGYKLSVGSGKLPKDGSILQYFQWKAVTSCNDLSETSVTNVRRQILLVTYALITTRSKPWSTFGRAVQDVYYLGLNRVLTSAQAKEMTKEEIYMRTRIFWNIYIIDCVSGNSLGRPFGINPDDIQLPFPRAEDIPSEDPSWIYFTNWCTVYADIKRKLHSLSARKFIDSEHSIRQTVDTLKASIENWNTKTLEILKIYYGENADANKARVAKHVKQQIMCWRIQQKYHFLYVTLCQPSFLVPAPDKCSLELLKGSSIKCIAVTFELHNAGFYSFSIQTFYEVISMIDALLYAIQGLGLDSGMFKTHIANCRTMLASVIEYSEVVNYFYRKLAVFTGFQSNSKGAEFINSEIESFHQAVKDFRENRWDYFFVRASDR